MSLPSDNDQALNELVESEVDFLTGDVPGFLPSDAREHPRYPFRGRAKAIVFPTEGRRGAEPVECEVLTTDVSRSGLSLLYRKQLYPGQQVMLVLNNADRLVEVCWCCRVWAGLYAAGCRFVGVPAAE